MIGFSNQAIQEAGTEITLCILRSWDPSFLPYKANTVLLWHFSTWNAPLVVLHDTMRNIYTVCAGSIKIMNLTDIIRIQCLSGVLGWNWLKFKKAGFSPVMLRQKCCPCCVRCVPMCLSATAYVFHHVHFCVQTVNNKIALATVSKSRERPLRATCVSEQLI